MFCEIKYLDLYMSLEFSKFKRFVWFVGFFLYIYKLMFFLIFCFVLRFDCIGLALNTFFLFHSYHFFNL
jgi:hypothetical protein